MKKILKLLLKPKYTFWAVCNLILDRALAPMMSDKLFLKMKYLLIMGKWPNIDHPATFNEKLQWLKINDRKSIYTTMVDKYEAKKYVSHLIGEEHIIPTLGVWDQVEDIDFDSLPNQFVLKITHDSGGLCICRDKTTFDREKAIKILRKALNRDYFLQNREWPYKNVKRRIIAEQFLSGMGGQNYQLLDYKFYCFNGEPKFLYISKGMDNHKTARVSFVSLEWKQASFGRLDYKAFDEIPPCPENFDDMVHIARLLSKGTQFLRVDLYNHYGKILFSELTFFPCSGMMPFAPNSKDLEIGDLLKLD